MAFMLEKTSGAGLRWPRACDGYSLSAARLHVEYNDGTGAKSLDARIGKSSDDIDARSGGTFFDSANLKMADQGQRLGHRAALRKPQHPQGRRHFAGLYPAGAGQSDSGTSNMMIYGHDHDNAPTFSQIVNGGALLGRAKTSASAAWSVRPGPGSRSSARSTSPKQ